ALLGEPWRRWQRRAVLRPVWYWEDDAVERSGAPADRRRRARMERNGRLQLRRRLLRENRTSVGKGRTTDLVRDAPLRCGARERRDGSGVAPGGFRRGHAHGELACGFSDRLHRPAR